MKRNEKVIVIGFVAVYMICMTACGNLPSEQSASKAESSAEQMVSVTSEASVPETTVSTEIIEAESETDGEIHKENTEEITEETTDNVESSEASEGLNPEFKEAMDQYEEFFDHYVEFMKKYQNADSEDMISMMGDYAEYMVQYADMMKKMEKIDNSELSAQDTAYYIEVTARINQKLLTIAQ